MDENCERNKARSQKTIDHCCKHKHNQTDN